MGSYFAILGSFVGAIFLRDPAIDFDFRNGSKISGEQFLDPLLLRHGNSIYYLAFAAFICGGQSLHS